MFRLSRFGVNYHSRTRQSIKDCIDWSVRLVFIYLAWNAYGVSLVNMVWVAQAATFWLQLPFFSPKLFNQPTKWIDIGCNSVHAHTSISSPVWMGSATIVIIEPKIEWNEYDCNQQFVNGSKPPYKLWKNLHQIRYRIYFHFNGT